MDETTYEFLTGASAFVIAILGVMLATTKILPESGLAKLRKARNILVPSYFVLSLLSVVCCLTGYDRRIEPASTLFVASFQSLLFTMSMLVFIRPNAVRWSVVFRQAGGITVAGIVLFVSLFCFTDYFSWFFYAGLIAYVVQLIVYTRQFISSYRKTVQEVEDYYDDDEESRLAWVKTGFYSALAIGVMAILIIFNPGWYKFFVPLYVVFYSFMVIWFVNYYHRMKFAIPIIASVPQEANVCAVSAETVSTETNMKEETAEETTEDATPEDAIPEDEIVEDEMSEARQALKERLQKYVDEKEYCQSDVPSGMVIASFGTSKAFFRQYMKSCYGIDFRPWRKELRIREASRLFAEHPEYSIEDVCEMVGYNNSSNFNRDFKQLMGMTPKCYCKQFL